MPLTLTNFQTELRAAFLADPVLATVPVLIEDGVSDNQDQGEQALAEGASGVCIIIQRGTNADKVSEASGKNTQSVVFDFWVPVTLQEKVKVNRAEGGTGTGEPIIRLAERMIQAALGHPKDKPHARSFRCHEKPLTNLGVVDGIEEYVLGFLARIQVENTVS